MEVRVCLSDEWMRSPPTATSDRDCALVSSCSAGFEELAGPSPTTDRTCVACREGYTWKGSAGQQTACVPVSECAAARGQRELVAATATSDRSCGDCAWTANGDAFLDRCGRCVLSLVDACTEDCQGVSGGRAYLDACDRCVSDAEAECTRVREGALERTAHVHACVAHNGAHRRIATMCGAVMPGRILAASVCRRARQGASR